MNGIAIVDNETRKKFLCICEGGNVRSAALALLLKTHCGQEAIALGWRFASDETMQMCCSWADIIVVMQRMFTEKVPKQFLAKVRVVDVGEDSYGTPMHPDLISMIEDVVKDWEERKFEI